MRTQKGMTATDLFWQIPVAVVVLLVGVMLVKGLSEKREARAKRAKEQKIEAKKMAEEKRIREEADAEAQRIAAEAKRLEEQRIQAKKLAEAQKAVITTSQTDDEKQQKTIKIQQALIKKQESELQEQRKKEIYQDPKRTAELFMKQFADRGMFYNYRFKYFTTPGGQRIGPNSWHNRGNRLNVVFSVDCRIRGKRAREEVTLQVKIDPAQNEWYVSLDSLKWPKYIENLKPTKHLSETEAMRR